MPPEAKNLFVPCNLHASTPRIYLNLGSEPASRARPILSWIDEGLAPKVEVPVRAGDRLIVMPTVGSVAVDGQEFSFEGQEIPVSEPRTAAWVLRLAPPPLLATRWRCSALRTAGASSLGSAKLLPNWLAAGPASKANSSCGRSLLLR